jgi:polyhydroxyalkanoate synthesis repressor PhaR
MSDLRIIKKYPNRRLYDTEQSRYITLTSVKELVMAGTKFKVIDSNSSADLTRSILLQIIMEEESHGKPIFSETSLAHLIRFYGGTAQGVFGQYLEESLTAFSNQQDLFSSTTQAPIQNITELAHKNLKIWSEMQSTFFKPPASDKDSDDKD